jgi:hypothetical protein
MKARSGWRSRGCKSEAAGGEEIHRAIRGPGSDVQRPLAAPSSPPRCWRSCCCRSYIRDRRRLTRDRRSRPDSSGTAPPDHRRLRESRILRKRSQEVALGQEGTLVGIAWRSTHPRDVGSRLRAPYALQAPRPHLALISNVLCLHGSLAPVRSVHHTPTFVAHLRFPRQPPTLARRSANRSRRVTSVTGSSLTARERRGSRASSEPSSSSFATADPPCRLNSPSRGERTRRLAARRSFATGIPVLRA